MRSAAPQCVKRGRTHPSIVGPVVERLGHYGMSSKASRRVLMIRFNQPLFDGTFIRRQPTQQAAPSVIANHALSRSLPCRRLGQEDCSLIVPTSGRVGQPDADDQSALPSCHMCPLFRTPEGLGAIPRSAILGRPYVSTLTCKQIQDATSSSQKKQGICRLCETQGVTNEVLL